MSLLTILGSNNYFLYNKVIAKNLSVESAIMLGFFSNQFIYYEKTNQLKNINGKFYFYATRETIFEETALSESISRKATKLLEEKNILNIEKIGIPAKNYYNINEKELEKYFQSIENSSSLKIKEQEVQEKEDLSFKNQSQILNNNSNKNNNLINIDDIEKENKEEKILKENIKCIIDYLNESIGSKYRYNNKTTIKLIKARFKDGYKLDDFYDVIDKKVKDWFNSEMQKYLRPETLFGNKFENYLNQKSFTGKPKSSYSSKPTFDNTSNHDIPKSIASMTEEEKEDFIENELAKDENGNFLKF